MFDRKGFVAIEKTDSIDEDELAMLAIELGAQDFEAYEDGFEIISEPTDFNKVRNGLQEAGYEFAAAELTYMPQNMVSLEAEDDIANMEKLIEILEDNDDVQDVYHNWDTPE